MQGNIWARSSLIQRHLFIIFILFSWFWLLGLSGTGSAHLHWFPSQSMKQVIHARTKLLIRNYFLVAWPQESNPYQLCMEQIYQPTRVMGLGDNTLEGGPECLLVILSNLPYWNRQINIHALQQYSFHQCFPSICMAITFDFVWCIWVLNSKWPNALKILES